MRRASTFLIVASCLLIAGWRQGSANPQSAERLTLEQARVYMLELINRDRASKGLDPVKLDPVATQSGQKHSDEMATEAYLAHWDLDGKLPDQRYTEAGGRDVVLENVLLQTRGLRNSGPVKLTLVENPAFTRREIEEIEAAYFNEVPPNDSHRRNILKPQHTHVGIALSRAAGPGASSLANTQEFVDRYVECDPIPQTMSERTDVTVSGKTLPGTKFLSVTIARGPSPVRMTVADLEKTRGYSSPNAFIGYWPEPYISPRPVQVTQEGQFKVSLRASEFSQPGLYYISVWVRQGITGDFIASQRTVVVK